MDHYPLTPQDYQRLVSIFMRTLGRAERVVRLAESRNEPLSMQLRKNFNTLKESAEDTIRRGTIEYSLGNEKDHASAVSSVISNSTYYAYLEQNAKTYGPSRATTELHIKSNKASIAGYKILQKVTSQFGFIFT